MSSDDYLPKPPPEKGNADVRKAAVVPKVDKSKRWKGPEKLPVIYGARRSKKRVKYIETKITAEADWEGAGDQPRSRSSMILIGGGAIFLAAICWFLYQELAHIEKAPARKHVSAEWEHEFGELTVSEFLESSTAAEISASAIAAVEGFMNGRTLLDRCRHVIEGNQEIGKMRSYYERPGVALPGRFVKVVKEELVTQGSLPFLAMKVLDDRGDEISFAVIPGTRRMLVDWNASVCYCEMDPQEFLEKKPVYEVLMRVVLTRRPGRHNQFPDEWTREEFVNLKFFEAPTQMIACLPPETKVHRDIIGVFRADPSMSNHLMTVRLRWNEAQRCPEITELEHRWWIDFEKYGPQI